MNTYYEITFRMKNEDTQIVYIDIADLKITIDEILKAEFYTVIQEDFAVSINMKEVSTFILTKR